MQKTPVRFFEVDENSSTQRLDNFLLARLKGVPKSLIYKLIRKGQIRINGKRCKPLNKLEIGDTIRVAPIVTSAQKKLHLSQSLAEQLHQSLLWETDNYLILNKPAGLASHAGGGLNLGTIEALKLLRKNEHLFLAHRLDKGTSGCLMIAKSRVALLALQNMYRQKTITKNYLAIVLGIWDTKISQVDLPLTSISGQDTKRVIVDSAGKSAQTNFKLVQNLGNFSLISASPITGRTHQIRVHCKSAGFPILGDDKYGEDFINKEITKQGFKRLFLHSDSLEFKDPFTQEFLSIKAQPDKNWQKFLRLYEN